MRTVTKEIVVDTYAWVEFFRGTRKGDKLRKLLLTTRAYTPSIVLAELARKYVREGAGRESVAKRLKFITETTHIVEVDANLALESAEAYKKLLEHSKKMGVEQKPSLIDAIILATAWALRAKVLTGDQHFKGLEETLWIGE